MAEFDRGQPEPFDPEHLKGLDTGQLVETLLDEARNTAFSAVDEVERAQIEGVIMEACWIPGQEDQEFMDEKRAEIDAILGRLFGAVAEEFEGREIVPGEAIEDMQRRSTGRLLAHIGRHKQELDHGLETGKDEDGLPWAEGSTKYHLKEICEAQQQAGIAVETDYVRQTALDAITTMPGMRGVVLLHNARSGDAESYRLGIEAMQEAVRADKLIWDDAHEGVNLVTEYLMGGGPDDRDELRDLAIDLLAKLRGWKEAPFASYAYYYAESTAKLAATLRDLDQGRG